MNYSDFDVYDRVDPYEAVRDALDDPYQDWAPEDIEDLLLEMYVDIEPEDVESFFKSLSKVGSQVGQTLQKAAPGILQGAASGAAAGSVAGPYGALIGALGGATIGGIGSATQKQAPSTRAQAPATSPTQPSRQSVPAAQPPAAPAPAAPIQGSPAAMQLLQLLSNPTVLQALMSMAMGSAGTPNTTVGNRSVPTTAVTNLLSQVSTRASQEASILQPRQGMPEYLMDSAGEFLVDPANAQERATVLLQMLNEEALSEDYDDYEYGDDMEFGDDEEDWYFDELDPDGFELAE